ncbi:50S ribosomal protein L9 [Verticiella sediminum]|uniref:Large ribosomal subunit protein bL9 n=1 Tax=Verticiella sediminum TaxID=1247510 RepID=A0A556ABI2_9BURK|nr:50S ribosomal protein L9 [Verticiella sediminum]TSH90259.1 50S ribosomal protein L9 [Verticiella sediminum]
MQIILLEKVANVGALGEVVRVKDGYARNYLIPQRKAKRATAAALKEFEARRAEIEKTQAERLAAAQAVAGKLEGHTVHIRQRAGVDGRLFGSVTNADIAVELKKAGFETVEKAMVRLPEGPFKTTGEYAVEVHLHTDVNANVNVLVAGETV